MEEIKARNGRGQGRECKGLRLGMEGVKAGNGRGQELA
jgi:hypothetical protein